MVKELDRLLGLVCRRKRGMRIVRHAAIGVLVGAALGLLAAVARLSGAPISGAGSLCLAVLGAALGACWGAGRRVDPRVSAAAIDACYDLRDRTVTALEFSRLAGRDVLQELQVAEALQHLAAVDPRRVAPLRLPGRTLAAAGALGVITMLILGARSGTSSTGAAAVHVDPAVRREAERLEQDLLEEVRAMASRQEEPVLKELSAQLRERLEEMKRPGVDKRDALAGLSEMQEALRAAEAALESPALAPALQELADALEPATATAATAEALRASDYETAAARLENVDARQFSPQDAELLSDSLENLAESLEQQGQPKWSDAVEQLAEGLREQDREQFRTGTRSLAGQLRDQQQREGLRQALAADLALLAESKSRSQGNIDGGNKVGPSNSPKSTWGQGVSNQPSGERSGDVESTRRQERLTGTQGAGPSQRERIRSAEARQQATRGLQQRYEEYRRQSETVLRSENLPLGYRHVIRRYFESIRPNAEQTEGLEDE